MRAYLNLLTLIVVACCGCGGMTPPPVDQAVTVTGKTTTNDGKPIGDVALNLQPLESGYVKSVDVKPDGSFSLEAIPGKYAYYFSAKAGAKPPANVAKYMEANMDRTVTIASGQSLDIQLAP